jgi:hypothetical protein
MNAEGVAPDAPVGRLLSELGLGDQIAGCRIRTRERNAGDLADQTAPAIAANQILRPQRVTIIERNIDTGFVLSEARHLAAPINRHAQLLDPAGEDALDMRLPQCKNVRMASRKIADVQRHSGEPNGVRLFPLGEEPIGDAALIEDFDRA